MILRNLKYILSYSYLCTHECVPRYSMVYMSVNPFFSMPVELIGVSGEATNARTRTWTRGMCHRLLGNGAIAILPTTDRRFATHVNDNLQD